MLDWIERLVESSGTAGEQAMATLDSQPAFTAEQLEQLARALGDTVSGSCRPGRGAVTGGAVSRRIKSTSGGR